MSEDVKGFINNVYSGNNVDAGQNFKDAIRAKVGDALENRRKEMAQNMFKAQHLQEKWEPVLNHSDMEPIKDAHKRPSYWGGYSFKPYYFEFWQGHDVRLNKREVYTLQENGWEKHFLQP